MSGKAMIARINAMSVAERGELISWCCRKIHNSQADEKRWGNEKIDGNNNTQWTTTLGEGIVAWVLTKLGKEIEHAPTINNMRPDWETDDAIWEVKTRNWNTPGTAGEKVLGCPFKYSDVPRLYGKPLNIVCVGYQEYELTNGNTRVFGDELSPEKSELLEFWASKNIHFVALTSLLDVIPTLVPREPLIPVS